MKEFIKKLIKEFYPDVDFEVMIPPSDGLGDYSINLPFILAKKENGKLAEVGEEILGKLQNVKEFEKYFQEIKLAGGGYINFYLSEEYLREQLLKILEEKECYGSGSDKKLNINLEYVSANPTGPVTVHNIRAAPYGDTLAEVMKKAGHKVVKEYYLNDAGNQVRLLGESVARRYLKIKGKEIEFPDNLYQGEYIIEIARAIDKDGSVNKIDNFDELVSVCRDYAINKLTESIKESLEKLGVEFDVWFSEKKLHESGEIENTLKMLEKGNNVYEEEGARWLKLNETGERDAVLVKSDGSYSYLMGDIAYTRDKFIRGADRAINIWGTDHHGDVPRLLAGARALNYEDGKLQVLLHQLVSVKSGGEKQKMSKRKGEFVLFDDLLKEVGKDAIRFFLLAKDLNTHMEFDIDLAKEQSRKNPAYYIQYANARLNSIFGKLQITNYKLRIKDKDLEPLKESEEFMLMRKMVKFPELVEDIARNYQVHRLAQFAFELASIFHNFYEKHRVIQAVSPSGEDDKNLEEARLALCASTQIILKSCLGLMGISTPDKM